MRGAAAPAYRCSPGPRGGPQTTLAREAARCSPSKPEAGAALAAVSVLLIVSVMRKCVTVCGSKSSGGLISRVSVSARPCTWRVATGFTGVHCAVRIRVIDQVACMVCTLVASPWRLVRATVYCERRTLAVVVPRRTWVRGCASRGVRRVSRPGDCLHQRSLPGAGGP